MMEFQNSTFALYILYILKMKLLEAFLISFSSANEGPCNEPEKASLAGTDSIVAMQPFHALRATDTTSYL